MASVWLDFLILPDPTGLTPPPAKAVLTFSVVILVSASWRFWVKMMLKTAWERLLVSFMFVAATVLGEQKPQAVTRHPEGCWWCQPLGPGQGAPGPPGSRAVLPGLMRTLPLVRAQAGPTPTIHRVPRVTFSPQPKPGMRGAVTGVFPGSQALTRAQGSLTPLPGWEPMQGHDVGSPPQERKGGATIHPTPSPHQRLWGGLQYGLGEEGAGPTERRPRVCPDATNAREPQGSLPRLSCRLTTHGSLHSGASSEERPLGPQLRCGVVVTDREPSVSQESLGGREGTVSMTTRADPPGQGGPGQHSQGDGHSALQLTHPHMLPTLCPGEGRLPSEHVGPVFLTSGPAGTETGLTPRSHHRQHWHPPHPGHTA